MTRRHVVAVVGAIATVVALVVALRPPTEEPTSPPTAEANGAPADQGERSTAVTAALDIATAAQDWLYLTDADIRAEVDRIATDSAAARLARAAATNAAAARESLQEATGPVWWLIRPLAWRIETFDGHHATISIWEIQILAARDVAAPQSHYRTVQIDLEWTEGRWLVDDLNESDGPAATPAPGAETWDSHTFDQALEGFTRVGAKG